MAVKKRTVPKAAKAARSKGREYCNQRLEDPKKFDKRSLRTVAVPGRPDRKVITGCPVGTWDVKAGKCKVGLKAQALRIAAKDRKCDCLFAEEAYFKRTGKKFAKPCPTTKRKRK